MTAPSASTLEIAASLFAGASAAAVALGVVSRRGLARRGFRRAFARLAERNERVLPRAWLARVDRWLQNAGRPRELTAGAWIAAAQVSAGAGLALGALASGALGLGPGLCAASLGVGAIYPVLWLRDRLRSRQRAISRALPYALDLLTLSVEAGLDFGGALAKVVEKGRQGPLADELSLVLKELRLGKTREQALHNLARRAGHPALTSFVQAVVHADRMGSPLGHVLRVQATQLRIERTHRAEKLAHEAPVKLLLPLVFCIFPTLFLMLFGPLVHQFLFDGSF